MKKSQLIAQIISAFDNTQKPTRIVAASTGGFEPSIVEAYFLNKDWREISMLQMVKDGYEGAELSALLFMSDEAFRYFLPAFLLININEDDIADLTFDTTLYRLTLPLEDHVDFASCREKFDGFSLEQKNVIADFLKYEIEVFPPCDAASSAYKRYWYQFDPVQQA